MGTWLSSLEAEARRVLPDHVFEYYRQGSRGSVTAGEAVSAWERHRLVPRVLRDVREVDLSTALLGEPYAAPFGVAPTTLQRAADPAGEVATARACAGSGIPMVLSSNASATFAEVEATGVSWWLQAYVTEDRSRMQPMLEAAVAAGADAVVLTVDTPVVGTKDTASGRTVFDQVPDAWVGTNLGVAAGAPKARDLGPDDIGWLRERTGLPVVVKGVLHPEDARIAIAAGAAAVWVSNHGGRQLDRAAPTADSLAGVVAAVDGAAEVYVDGGVRDGIAALTALALGADAIFLGRPPLYALATAGAEGVARLFRDLGDELVEALRLAGFTRPADVRGPGGSLVRGTS